MFSFKFIPNIRVSLTVNDSNSLSSYITYDPNYENESKLYLVLLAKISPSIWLLLFYYILLQSIFNNVVLPAPLEPNIAVTELLGINPDKLFNINFYPGLIYCFLI